MGYHILRKERTHHGGALVRAQGQLDTEPPRSSVSIGPSYLPPLPIFDRPSGTQGLQFALLVNVGPSSFILWHQFAPIYFSLKHVSLVT